MSRHAPRLLAFTLALLLSCASPAGAAARQEGQSAEEPLTNASVIKLVRAGFAQRTLIAIIGSRPTRFDLSPDRLVELKKRGVSEKVILAMLARGGGPSLAGADWADDPFFDEALPRRGAAGGGGAPRPADPGGAGDPGEVNIFGSSGGARGRTRTNGVNGGGEDDTQTLGSASVRILRPPAEAGGAAAAPKLERTPTLTNDSVVQLVEAGFSEGTIVRRIESSPADFDFSPKKLEELRRKRVSDRVIAAMRAAMGDDAPAGNPTIRP